MKFEIDGDIPNLIVLTGEVSNKPGKEPQLNQRGVSQVLNFSLVVNVKDFNGNTRSMFPDCSAWGEEVIAEVGATIGRAIENGAIVRVYGSVVAGAYPTKFGERKPVGVLRVNVLKAVLKAEDLSKEDDLSKPAKPPAKKKAAVAVNTVSGQEGQKPKAKTKAGGKASKAKKPRRPK
jgi:hypothetical protein